MNLPPLSHSGFERVLHHLLNARGGGMDADDATDWIENHYSDHDKLANKELDSGTFGLGVMACRCCGMIVCHDRIES